MNKTLAKRYLKAIEEIRNKYVTLDLLSKKVGKYSDVISDELSYFDPLLKMDIGYNFKDLVPSLEEYIESLPKEKKKEQVVIHKKQVEQYKSVADFLYQKMTVDGIVDKNASLSEVDLKLLRKIINEELANLKKK